VPVLLEMLDRSGEVASLRAMERGTERLLVVPAAEHGYVRVEPERLRRLWSVLLSLYEHGAQSKQNLRVRGDEAGVLSGLKAAFEGVEHHMCWSASAEGAAEQAFGEPAPIDPAS